MKRRDWLKGAAAAAAGLTIMTPFGRRGRVFADGDKYPGPYWICVHAGGGFDTTFFCDPHPALNSGHMSKGDKTYPRAETGGVGKDAGNIPYSDLGAIQFINGCATDDLGCATYDYFVQRFFTSHHARMCVVNGIDTATNAHNAGVQTVWSGRFDLEYPSLAAVIAAASSPGNPTGFLSYGGYDQTSGLVPVTRLGDVTNLKRIISPDDATPNSAWGACFGTLKRPDYLESGVVDRVRTAQVARLQQLRDSQQMPSAKKMMGQIYAARTGPEHLTALTAAVEGIGDVAGNDLTKNGVVALASFLSGATVSASLVAGDGLSFDTHSAHVERHGAAMKGLLDGVDGIIHELMTNDRYKDLRDKVYIVIGSDFARTPGWNASGGKDHWNITSMAVWGPEGAFPQDRVVGATDDGLGARNVDPTTLSVVDSGGVRLTTAHVNKALRRLAKVSMSSVASTFLLEGDDLPLFG